MRCRRIARLLPLAAGGDLGPRRSSAVASHVAGCDACRQIEESLAESLRLLRAVPAPSFSQAERTALRRAVWGEIARDRAERFSRRVPLLAWGAAAAALVLAVALALRHRPLAPLAPYPAPSTLADESAVPIAPAPLAAPRDAAPKTAPLIARRVLRPRPAAPAGAVRIEFRTQDPDVRIIWLVRGDAAAASAPLPADPTQEVS